MEFIKLGGRIFTQDPKVPGDYEDMDRLIKGYLPSYTTIRRYVPQYWYKDTPALLQYGYFLCKKPAS